MARRTVLGCAETVGTAMITDHAQNIVSPVAEVDGSATPGKENCPTRANLSSDELVIIRPHWFGNALESGRVRAAVCKEVDHMDTAEFFTPGKSDASADCGVIFQSVGRTGV